MKRHIGVRIAKDQKTTKIALGPEMKEYFDKLSMGKNHIDYIKEFLITKKNYQIVEEAMTKAKTDSLPPDIEDNCQYCNDSSDDENDKKCSRYYAQMDITYLLSVNEYIRIVLSNKHVYDNKKLLLLLTQKFFKCFHFIKGHGLMYFDLDAMIRETLNIGFLSVSQIFSKSDTLKNLSEINITLNNIEEETIQNKVLEKEDYYYLDLQKEFFINKQRFYKEKLFIENQENSKKKSKAKTDIKQSIPKYVLYYYYLQLSGDFPYFENHPGGKLNGIKDVIKNDQIATTPKYFQIKYNKIAHYKSNRIAKNQESNIDYVANNMLNDYPIAKEIALSELQQAQSKYR